jgi:hypothetical protein
VISNRFGEKVEPVLLETGENIGQAFLAGRCNVFAGGLSDLLDAEDLLAKMDSNISFSNVSTFVDVIEPLALVTRQDDQQWSDFVALVVTATFYAEEGITAGSAMEMPEVHLFGSQYTNMLRNSISKVGPYNEIYRRNIQDRYERSGLNRLYSKNSSTPLLYAPQDLTIRKD